MIVGYISGQKLELVAPTVVSDTINYLTTKFIFDGEAWTSLDKFVFFTKGDETYCLPLNEDRTKPEDGLNLPDGVWMVNVVGLKYDEDMHIQTQITTTACPITVSKAVAVDGPGFPDVPESVAQKIMKIIGDMESLDTTEKDNLVAAINEVLHGERDTQTDYDENDETSPAYMKNRPFYEYQYIDGYDHTFPASETTWSGWTAGGVFQLIGNPCTLNPDRTYLFVVTLGTMPYQTQTKPKKLTLSDVSGHPEYVDHYGLVLNVSSVKMVFVGDTMEIVAYTTVTRTLTSIRIYDKETRTVDEIKKLDKKFLPDIEYEDIKNPPDIPDISAKQDALVSGENIKTLNGESILGSGDIKIPGGSIPDGSVSESKLSASVREKVDAVPELKQDLASIMETSNKYDPETAVVGVLTNNGDLNVDENTYFTSDYIYVGGKPFTVKFVEKPADSYLRIGCYSGSKVWNMRELLTVTDLEYSYANVYGFQYVKLSLKDNVKKTMTVITFESTETTAVDKIVRRKLPTLEENVQAVDDKLYQTLEKTIEWVAGFVCVGGSITIASKDKTTKPFVLYAGETVHVKTKGDGSYVFNYLSSVDSIDTPISAGYNATGIAQITGNSLTTYSYTATNDIILVASVYSQDGTGEIWFENLKRELRFEIIEQEISKSQGVLKNKSVMFFGDSLTAASTNGVVGFAELIANEYGTPYKAFLYDSAEGSQSDYNCVTNYAKDGTMNRVISSREDSVLERVKRHIVADTDVDYVLIECCVNDMAASNRNKGTISDSYTADYDTNTTIGALEETLRYLTTLGKTMKIGGFIPWLISWQSEGWFDDYIDVFEKWGVPLFDMRKCSGFNLYRCSAHRLLYTLTSDSYEAYSDTKTYNLDDKVKYQGSLYKCLANGVVGVLPTYAEKWMSVSSESADGTHLNSLGHRIVSGKIQNFIESL